MNPNVPLDNTDFCTWRFGIHPMPIVALNPPRVRIDDRCNFPRDPNPNTDGPTGIYSGAEQDPSREVAKISDGTEIVIGCYAFGQNVSDAMGDSSRLWLGIQTPDGTTGYIPDVDVGGGYTQQQLDGLGLGQCQ